jgi:hypothetical protein
MNIHLFEGKIKGQHSMKIKNNLFNRKNKHKKQRVEIYGKIKSLHSTSATVHPESRPYDKESSDGLSFGLHRLPDAACNIANISRHHQTPSKQYQKS